MAHHHHKATDLHHKATGRRPVTALGHKDIRCNKTNTRKSCILLLWSTTLLIALQPSRRIRRLSSPVTTSTTRLWLPTTCTSSETIQRWRMAAAYSRSRIRASATWRASLWRATRQVSVLIAKAHLSDSLARPSNHKLQCLCARKPQCPSSTPTTDAILRPRCTFLLRLPILSLYRPPQGPPNRYQLLQPERPATWLHQRRQEHVDLSQWKFWLC